MHRLLVCLSAAGLLLFMTACRFGPTERRCEGAVWGTTYHIKYISDRSLDDSIIAVMRQVENSLSPFIDSSLVSRINAGLTDETDSLFRHIFRSSCRINELSDGAFDPTVAPLVNLWGFGYRNMGEEPNQALIDSALQLVGIGRCHLDGSRIVKPLPATEFNFSAITKGYGCDMIAEMLRRNGSPAGLVEIGGEIRAWSDENRDGGNKWRIMIEAPVENDTVVSHNRMAVISVDNCGVATSGNYRNYRSTSQGKIWHTISPQTGRPAETDLLSVTVVAPDAMTADALATACMAMPSSKAAAMIDRMPDVAALLVKADSAGYLIETTRGFPSVETAVAAHK